MTNDVNKRLNQYNLRQVKSTKHRKPYKLVYQKKFNERIEARDYEKFLKIKSNKEKIINSLDN